MSVSAFGLLRVLIFRETGGAYYAQGLEFNYGTEGTSLEDVKKRFLAGLREMFEARRQSEGVLVAPASPPHWIAALFAVSGSVCPHADFEPYEGIHWLQCF
jgi:hypothetical protein